MHNFQLNGEISPQTLLSLTQQFAEMEGTCLLFSGGNYATSTQSFLCLFPYDRIVIQKDHQCRYGLNQSVRTTHLNPWDALKELGLSFFPSSEKMPEWVGFFAYEMGAYSDEELRVPHFLPEIPWAYWQRNALLLKVDHLRKQGEVWIAENAANYFDDQRKIWIERLSTQEGWETLLNGAHSKKDEGNMTLIGVSDTEAAYVQKINEVRQLIAEGEVYQLNLSQMFTFRGCISPFSLFAQLAESNPAPFSAYLYFKEFAIISASPERFLMKTGTVLETRPIKGTAPRGNTFEEDEVYRRQLLASPKERAELLMITDLMRNDLGSISQPGSVETPLIWGCEAYANVFHLYSIIRARIKEEVDPLDAVRACFPGGSITGCPKLRAMQAIAAFEKRPRGIYTGSIGYFARNGDFNLNIAIRTLVAKEGTLTVSLGGGIVADSDPHREYQETLQKGRAIFNLNPTCTLSASQMKLRWYSDF